MTIGIVGKIGSGKTTLLDFLSKSGYEVIIMDKIGHKILKEKESEIKKEFNIKRSKNIRLQLGKIVFSDSEKLKKLNSILHPRMKEELIRLLDESNEKYVFVEAAVLFEMGIQNLMDKIVYLDVSDDVAIKRVKNRNNLEEKDIIKIIKSQKNYNDVKKFIDIYIDTTNMSKQDAYKTLVNKLNLEV